MFFSLILVFYSFTINVDGLFRPSYRSSVVNEGKPILRMKPDVSDEEIERSSLSDENAEQEWMNGLRTRIENYVDRYGYDKAKPYIQKLVQEIENSHSLLLHVKVSHNGKSKITYKHALRTTQETSTASTISRDPAWLVDFKAVIKDLIGRYGMMNFIHYVIPIIMEVQKKQNVIIKDIDVNQYGNIEIRYENGTTPVPAAKTVKMRQRHRRKTTRDYNLSHFGTEILTD